MKDNELIVCRDVSLGYEGKSVLTDLDLTIAKGDYLCVVGDNGSGKSTLMRGLLGLIQPQSGTIEHAPALKHGAIGYLPQQTRAQRDFPATVLEVVLSGCLNRQGLHFFYTPAQRSEAMMNLHLKVLYGENDHHKLEAMFKAFAKALDAATRRDARIDGVLSTKGTL